MEHYKNLSLDVLSYIDKKGDVCLERWLPITGYEGKYEVSDLGRVKSLERSDFRGDGHPFKVEARILKTQVDKYGYVYSTLSNNKKFKVHRLVGIAFVPNPGNKETINHFDEVKSNNRFDNLGWFSIAEQNKYSKGINISFYHKGDILNFPSVNEAAETLSIDNSTISTLVSQYNKAVKVVNDVLLSRELVTITKPEVKPYSVNTSGYAGVSLRREKWYSRVSHQGVRYFVGSYSTIEEAIEARDLFIIANNINLPLQFLKNEDTYSKDSFIKSWKCLKDLILSEDCSDILKSFVDTHNTYVNKVLK